MASQSGFIVQPYKRKALKGYSNLYSKDNLTPLWDDNVASVLEAQGFSIQESPRSIYKVEKLYEALDKYSPDHAPYVQLSDPYVQHGITLAYACFSNHSGEKLSLQPFTPRLVHEVTSNHKASAGLTNVGKSKAESEYRAYERGIQIVQGIKKPEPCLAFKRTQFNDKTRLVWGYPYSMTALEGIFARPLIEVFKDGCTPMAFGMQTGVLGSKLRVSSYHKEYAYSLDVKSFDSSANGRLIQIAFDILSTWFDLDLEEITTSRSYREIWNIVVKYFIHTPIVMPNMDLYKGKKHGVPSGSYFTQMIDSIINVIYAGAMSARFNLFLDKSDINVLGDDLIFWTNRNIDLEKLAKFGSKTFGIVFNADKSEKFHYDQPIHYLGRDWVNGIPTQTVDEILVRMTQPESFRKYPKDDRAKLKQVYLLLMSYAAVYQEAYPIYLKTLGRRVKWDTCDTSLHSYILHLSDIETEDNYALSGLQRFQRKYLNQDDGGFTPLALQFWK